MPHLAGPNRLVSVWVVFFVNGAVLSSWAPRIPEVKGEVGLSDIDLGIALLGIAAGAAPALAVTARALTAVRDGSLCLVAAGAFSAALPLVTVAGDVVALTAVLVVLGAASGTLDVAMNAAGMNFQMASGRRVLSRLHGGYSLGVLAGAGGGVLATQIGSSVGAHFLATSTVLLAVTLLAAPGLLASPSPSPSGQRAGLDHPPRRAVRLPMTVAVLAVSCLSVEGLVSDWTAVLITRDLGAHPTAGAVAFAVFSLTMFISRSCGEAALRRVGERHVLLVGAAAMPAAVATAVVAQSAAMAIVAVACVGLLLGPLFPLAVSRAAYASPHRAALMTAKVSQAGYLAYLCGPPLVGIVADAVGLPVTYVLVVALASAGIAAAGRTPHRADGERPPVRAGATR